MWKWGTILVGLSLSIVVYATEKEITQIEVMALFKNKVMVSINNKQHLLNVGDDAILGIKLIKATSKHAVLDINGEKSKYILGNRVQANYTKTENKKVIIYSDSRGMYKTVGSINGYPVDLLVDTGASVVALNSATAKRLGIQYKLKGEETIVATASGNALAFSVSLDQIKVGEIMMRNIEAVIIEGNNPETTLLGMSYLGRLKLNNEGQTLELEEKF
jgi:aspartyl protease family protein